jgi:HPt (histidine-containing phosphotransfer) domain-containing protein
MDDYISKPIQLPELAKVIERNRPGAPAVPADATHELPALTSTSAEATLDYDREVIDRFVSVAGPAGASIVLAAMIDSAPGMLEGLQRAIAAGDRKEIRRHAHSLKTNARTVGANAIARQFQELEHLGSNAPLDGAAASSAAAATAYRQLIDAVRRLREQLDA